MFLQSSSIIAATSTASSSSSVSSSLSSLSSPSSMSVPKRAVTFNKKVRVRWHTHLSTLNGQEIMDSYYQPYEFDDMIEDYVQNVELMEASNENTIIKEKAHDLKMNFQTTFWCTSCLSSVGTKDGPVQASGLVDAKMKKSSKTSRWPLHECGSSGDDDQNLGPRPTASGTSTCFCSCFRGLETRQRRAEKLVLRKRSWRAVLKEQDKSYCYENKYEKYDVDAIAIAYKIRGRTIQSLRRAQKIAQEDERVASSVQCAVDSHNSTVSLTSTSPAEYATAA